MKLTNLSRIAGDEIEALRTSLDRACVTIPDGRRLLATEHAALMTFARANGIIEKMLWDRITIRHHGRRNRGKFRLLSSDRHNSPCKLHEVRGAVATR